MKNAFLVMGGIEMVVNGCTESQMPQIKFAISVYNTTWYLGWRSN